MKIVKIVVPSKNVAASYGVGAVELYQTKIQKKMRNVHLIIMPV